MKKKKIIVWVSVVAVVLIIATVVGVLLFSDSSAVSKKIGVEEAQKYVDDSFASLVPATAHGTKAVFAETKVTVNSVRYGQEKDAILDCTYQSKDVGAVIDRAEDLVKSAYGYYLNDKNSGKMVNSLRISMNMKEEILQLLDNAKPVSGKVTLYLYETSKGHFELHLDDEMVNTCTGGLIAFKNKVNSISAIEYEGETKDLSKIGAVRNGVIGCLKLQNHVVEKPDTGNALQKAWHSFQDQFYRNFIYKGRWGFLTNGLLTTLTITALSAVFGILLGFIVAIIRCTYQTTGKLKVADKICAVYLTIIRGTPVMVQLLIIYFVILLPAGVEKLPSAVMCFGLNSGAYVAEIVRGGIMAIDRGQNEAGRSLGFGFAPTMLYIIIPQAFKAVLPALANEFITLLKESSVAFYIGVADLTQGGLKIRSLTYSNFLPLIAVALIYLVIVLILTRLVGILERRLRKSDH